MPASAHHHLLNHRDSIQGSVSGYGWVQKAHRSNSISVQFKAEKWDKMFALWPLLPFLKFPVVRSSQMQGLFRWLAENTIWDLVQMSQILVTNTRPLCSTDYKLVWNTAVEEVCQPFIGLQNQKMCRLWIGKAIIKISDYWLLTIIISDLSHFRAARVFIPPTWGMYFI